MPKYLDSFRCFHLSVWDVRWLSFNFDAFSPFVFWCFISSWFCAILQKHTNKHYACKSTYSILNMSPVRLIRKWLSQGWKIPQSNCKNNSKQNESLKRWFRPPSPPLSPQTSRIPSKMLEFECPRSDEIKFQVSKMGDGRIHLTIHMYFVL